MFQKTCKNKDCKKKFTHKDGLIGWCSPSCGWSYSQQLKEKKKKKKKTENRIALREYKKNDKPVLLLRAQALVNKYIRKRDKGKLCISCHHNFLDGRQEHAGHYIPRSKSSLLRFDETNINTQCNICNDHLSGNVGEYRVGLILKVGLEQVEYLEANKTTLKTWTVEDLQEIIKIYTEKVKDE